MFKREDTVSVKIGSGKSAVFVGGNAPVSVQSMLNKPAHDFEGNINQAVQLEKAGCEIIRVSVPDMQTVPLISKLKEAVNVPIVADIHFDYKLAIESVYAGVDKIRINPGNIGDDSKVKQVVDVCKAKNIPVRVGVNSGSVEKHILSKYGAPTPKALIESGMYHISLLEKFDFDQIVLSLKSSNVKTMFETYMGAAEVCRYPLHLGVTEAGTLRMGTLRSAAGIGGLLLNGIGSTIRVSLTDDPITEVKAGIELLNAIGLRDGGVRFVSCPTCGRTSIDLVGLAKKAEEALADCKKSITVAIMGCVVNGPGEAKEADIGIAGGKGEGIIFKKGEIIKKLPEEQLLSALLEEVEGL
ncbi:MAG: flavodoxin-dependent (E)-4-hydroxy-3-methylbut-2-enyl-diphosphate synthase [Acutalibacteraceae bacterium]|nr:flavodoxin-dependent (E)-4-hydroxy-3-methylbut-2-enyl-diphosphate synthase [Acutalibacteraceae bacterium]